MKFPASVMSRSAASAVIACCLQLTVSAQQWEHKHDSLSFSSYDRNSGTLLEASPNGYRLYRPQEGKSSYISLPGFGKYLREFVFPLNEGPAGSSWLLVQYQGGLTYRLTSEGLERIDSDHLNRMTLTMQAFMRNDTVYTQGGYGFWSARSHVNYFNRRTGKWELHRPAETSENPPGLLNHWAFNMGDSLFTFGGHTIDPYDPLQFLTNTSLWIYRFKSREWHQLGEMNPKLAVPNDHFPTIQIGNKVILFPVEGLTAELDFQSMKVRFHEPTPANSDMFRKMHPGARPFLADGKIYYCRITDNNAPGNLAHRSEWVSAEISELLGPVVSEEDLVKSGITITWWWLALPFTIFILFVFLRKRKTSREKVFVNDQGFRYKQTDYPAGPDSIRLVRMLLSSAGPVANQEIMDLISNTTQDYSHNIRVKNQLVDKTNIQLRSMLQIQEDLIICERSARDKRVRTYSIRKEFFD